MKKQSIGVMLDDTTRPAKLWAVAHCSTGQYYVRPLGKPDAPLRAVCVDDFWILVEGVSV